MWVKCTVCQGWYQDTEYVSCAKHTCANFKGTHRHGTAHAIRMPATNADAPQVALGQAPKIPVPAGVLQRAVLPAPHRAMLVSPPSPRLHQATVATPGVPAATTKSVAASFSLAEHVDEPDCVVCASSAPGIDTPCCGLRVCSKCMAQGGQSALFRIGDKVICAYCPAEITPSVYLGKADADMLRKVQKTIEYLKNLQTGSESGGASDEESAWNFSIKCPACKNLLPGLEGGCDIIKCTKCGVQVNLATGTSSKSGLVHSFELGAFQKLISGFDSRSGSFVIKECQSKYAGLWKVFKFDVLLTRLEAVRGRQDDVTTILAKLWAPEVQSLKAFLFYRYASR